MRRWAGPFAPIKPLSDAFLAYARPLSLLGKIPGLRTMPFNVSVAAQTAVGVYSWVGESRAEAGDERRASRR